MAIIFGVPSLLDNIQAQTNTTNTTSPILQNQTVVTAEQNQTMSKDAQALMTSDLPELKNNIINAKEALSKGDIGDALTTITDIENQVLFLKEKPSFEQNIKQVKDAISKSDLNKALDDITKVQTDVIKAETDLFKAKLQNPQLTLQGEDDDDDSDN